MKILKKFTIMDVDMKNENLKLHYNKNEIGLNENIQFYHETNFKQTEIGPQLKDWQVVKYKNFIRFLSFIILKIAKSLYEDKEN